ncbi:3-keto-5-aminohexanoate cleavage protein [Rhodobacteraceae bacterium KMM 6894]|nr:3-keto-5-aminohexanoate cleavage protein [Rhodobacteraceae bacterium KMM 6894]
MDTNRKIILTSAVTGAAPFNPKHPSMPITPAQIADAAHEAAAAGASIVHLHVRDPETGKGCRNPALFQEVVERIRATGVDIVLNITCGAGAVFIPDPKDESRALPESDVACLADRVAHIEQLLPEIATIDVTTGNQIEGDLEYVYLNTTRTLRGLAKRFQEIGVKPELEVFSAGDIEFSKQLISEGLIDGPPLIQMVTGVKWGAPTDTATVLYQRSLLPDDAIWAAFGLGRNQMRMLAQAALLGGNVRVGLEDNLYLSRGVFATNGQLVERGRTILEHMGFEIATPSETRKILKLKSPA